ncbi:MAG: HEAT repeat domain-containing protein [Aphanocapsa sp. GSE-SYN-MK-11-07L]|jgi:HEAT repeat protein|nr:HEAT repeat domain-containing protein [Aphanocapsa sp. GSE-SYN-MK-11-07L]
MSAYPELDQLGLKELIARWHQPAIDGEAYAASYYQEIVDLIRQQGEAGVKFLLAEVPTANLQKLAAILCLLPPVSNRKLINQIWTNFLKDDRPEIVASAIDGLRHQHIWQVRDQVFALSKHPAPCVRGSVLRYMSQYDPKIASVMLVEALDDPDYTVRENALDELDQLGAVEAIPLIRSLLTDSHPDVQKAAETALENLAQLKKGAWQRKQLNASANLA